jgi:GrpB-like predicted nucleotidyltransferase (UPF0157 family)
MPPPIPVFLAAYDPEWPQVAAGHAERLQMLGSILVIVHHIGSTSVPGLAAKPRIDVLLEVPSAADEAAYVPALERAGYVLRIREPDWYEHRMFKGPDTDVNIHTFSAGCPESGRMLCFRDWLRTHEDDRRLYEATKRDLAARSWRHVQNYADAKTAVVETILARAGCPGPPTGGPIG